MYWNFLILYEKVSQPWSGWNKRYFTHLPPQERAVDRSGVSEAQVLLNSPFNFIVERRRHHLYFRKMKKERSLHPERILGFEKTLVIVISKTGRCLHVLWSGEGPCRNIAVQALKNDVSIIW